MNLQAILSSFYAGTDGMNIGLIYSVQEIKGGPCWERIFYRHSPRICWNVMNITKEIIYESLKEEINLTITENLKEKFNKSKVENFTYQYQKE